MGNRFTRSKAVVLLTGLVMVVMGIAALINPIGAIETLVRIMGWVLLAYAVITLVSVFAKGDPMKKAPADFALGVIAALSGLVMVIAPSFLVAVVWTIIGLIILMTGVLDIMEASVFRRARSPLATPATASGVITAVLGVLVIVTPMASATLGMFVAAVALIVDGLTEIIFGLGM